MNTMNNAIDNDMLNSKRLEAYAEFHLGAGGSSLKSSLTTLDEARATLNSKAVKQVMFNQGNIPLGIIESPGLNTSNTVQFVGIAKLEVLLKVQVNRKTGTVKPLVTPIYTKHDNCSPDTEWQNYPQTTPFVHGDKKTPKNYMVYVAPAKALIALQSTNGNVYHNYYDGDEKLNEFKVIIGKKSRNLGEVEKAFVKNKNFRTFALNNCDESGFGYFVVTVFGLVSKYQISKNNKKKNETEKKHTTVNPFTGEGFEHRMNLCVASAFVQQYSPGLNPIEDPAFQLVEDLAELKRHQSLPGKRVSTQSRKNDLVKGTTQESKDKKSETQESKGTTQESKAQQKKETKKVNIQEEKETIKMVTPNSEDNGTARVSNLEENLNRIDSDSNLYRKAENLGELGKVTVVAYLLENYYHNVHNLSDNKDLLKEIFKQAAQGKKLSDESLIIVLECLNNFVKVIPHPKREQLCKALDIILSSEDTAKDYLAEFGPSDSFVDEDDDDFGDIGDEDQTTEEAPTTGNTGVAPDPFSGEEKTTGEAPNPLGLNIPETPSATGTGASGSSYEEVPGFFNTSSESKESSSQTNDSPSPFSVTEEYTDQDLPGTGNGSWGAKNKSNSDSFLDTQNLGEGGDPSGLTD